MIAELTVDGITVIEKGASVRGRVIEVKKARSFGRAGKLDISIQDVLAIDGERIPLRASEAVEGDGNTGKVTGAIVVTTILFFPAAPLWGFVKGKNIDLPIGTRVPAFIHGDYSLKIPGQQDAEQSIQAITVAQAGEETRITATPLGSISIDASFLEVRKAATKILTQSGYTIGLVGSNLVRFRIQAGSELIELEIRLFDIGQKTNLEAFLFKVHQIPLVGETREPFEISSDQLRTTLQQIQQSAQEGH